MNLQEKLIELSDYGVSFNVSNGNFVVRIRYNSEWDIISPENEKISFYRDDNDNDVYYYVAPVSMNIEYLFAAIDETIDYNHELEEKVVLFKEKMTELQSIFTEESIEVLKTLEFRLKKKKEKIRKAKQSEETNENNKVTDIVENQEELTEDTNKKEHISDIDAKINEVLGE